MNREKELSLMSKIKREQKEDVIIEVLKDLNVDTHIIDGTILNYAVIYDRLNVARYLLEKGANVNALYEGDYSPLMAAVDKNNTEMVKLILKYNPSINLLDKHGNSALWKAVLQNNIEIATLLLETGADPLIKNNYGGSVYEFVKEAGPIEMLNIINKYK